MFGLRIERRMGGPMCEVQIGAHGEDISIDLRVWDAQAYRASWLRSAAHVLEHGYGRFLLSVSRPGDRIFTTLVCRTRFDRLLLFKSLLLPSATNDYADPAEAETIAEDFAARNDTEPELIVWYCDLSDMAAFESRLRGTRMG
ncbi:MAG: hypothetical protein AB7T59_14860 [Hyphomonadaceae bacterium]